MAVHAAGARHGSPEPMLATLRPVPASGDGVAVEWKYDGQRTAVVVDPTGTWIVSRNGVDVSRTFPELAAIGDEFGGRRVILDGEIVAVDAQGRPSFTRLQRRWPQHRRPTPTLLREVPVRVLAFDIVALGNRSLTGLPYCERRDILAELTDGLTSPVLTVPQSFSDVSPADMLQIAGQHGMEGVVVKRVDSPYVSGRTTLWTKHPVRSTAQLLIVAFWHAGGPGGARSVGSVLLAGHNAAGDLVVVGQVGTGFSASTRRHLFELLDPIRRTDPPVVSAPEVPGAVWVQAETVGEVAYREYVAGRWLRHTSWKGLRDAVDPATVAVPPVTAPLDP
ncbi:ATP-dependent DNA ligase [Mycobacterium sp. JS623]|uniref:ATP-dependent DNA ligase n=1 Tax=Mycobacterium sp. JS623 TaxID=212767 RepID=UPI001E2CA2AB|nr:RNA ligase family protein [Mycobacterium sp. JS623]